MTIQTELQFFQPLYYLEQYAINPRVSSIRAAGRLRTYLDFCENLIQDNKELYPAIRYPWLKIRYTQARHLTESEAKLDGNWFYQFNTHLIMLETAVDFYFEAQARKHFGQKESYEYLSLSLHFITRLTAAGLAYIAENANYVHHLIVSNQALEYISPSISLLEYLETLKIDNNKLTALPELNKLSNLQTLYINNNSLEISGLKKVLEKLPESLRTLHISKDQVQALPHNLPAFLKTKGVIKVVDMDLTLDKNNYRKTIKEILQSAPHPPARLQCTLL